MKAPPSHNLPFGYGVRHHGLGETDQAAILAVVNIDVASLTREHKTARGGENASDHRLRRLDLPFDLAGIVVDGGNVASRPCPSRPRAPAGLRQYIVVGAGGNTQIDFRRGNNIIAFSLD